jgi:vitamin B12/bleomycin/antimicrobial peptide transport system ATP-binding/permease protein
MNRLKQLEQYSRWVWQISKLYWVSSEKRGAITIAFIQIVFIIIENQISLMLNDYHGKTATALQAKSSTFYQLILISTGLGALNILSWIFKSYFEQKLQLFWREWLTKDFINKYFHNKAYHKINSNKEIDNPDERLSEDIESFVEYTLEYSFSLGDTILRGFLFFGVLWSIDRFLVLATIIVAILRTIISILLGKPLIPLRNKSLKLKPDFRYSLVQVRNNSESIAFYSGEEQELETIQRKFGNFLAVLHQSILPRTTLNAFETCISITFGLILQLILAPEYFDGKIPFGDIARSTGACWTVLDVLSWFSYSFGGLISYAAVIKRLGTFSDFIESPNLLPYQAQTIETIIDDRLALSHVCLQTPDYKRTLVQDLSLEVPKGKGLLLIGPSGSGKSSILRAIAGLWNSGEGYIYRPQIKEIFFIPQRPYMILGSLRAQLLYPHTKRDISDEQLQSCLAKVNLGDLAARVGGFDVELNWADILSLGEQQKLAFARLFLANPRYAVLDESTSALDVANEKHLYELIKSLDITFISVGHRPTLLQYHESVVQIAMH